MKCLREKGQGPRIDQYFLRSQSSQSNEIQRQEANHSSQDISTPVIDVRRTCMDTVSDEPNDPCEPGQTNQHKREKNLNGHKPGVKWPRACEKTAWNTVNTDLCFALERLSGTVEKKLDKFGDIIYAYGSERFGVEKRKEKVQTIPGKSRRQQEIERLVRERRQLRKQWRRAEQSLVDGKHCTLPHIPGKTFVFNAAEDRLELCVDAAGHFPVGPDVEDLVKEALNQLQSEVASRSREGSPSHGVLKLGSGGVVRKKSEQSHNVMAFQGKGHSLGTASGSSPPDQKSREKQISRKHSSGVDLSGSISKQGASLTKISDDAKELIRMAPGFVTVKDGRNLDPNVIEAQRKKLQEMVSSIQASMDKHLQEENIGDSLLADPAPRNADAGDSASRTESAPTSVTESVPETGGPELSDMEVAAIGIANLVKMTLPSASANRAQERSAVSEELEEMDSQDTELTGATEPMDHS
ncbi:UNVERIFIED_CONTAM: hypothetical protein FKN15_017885 [Acipenser sinensis]